MARALAVLSLLVALCAYRVAADPDANVVIEDLKQSTALANKFTAQINAVPGLPLPSVVSDILPSFVNPLSATQPIEDGVNALKERFVEANQYLQDNPGTFAKESETAALQAYTAYVQAQKGFLSASVQKKKSLEKNILDSLVLRLSVRRIRTALVNLRKEADDYGSRLEDATPGQAPEVESQATASSEDLQKAIDAYST